MAVTAQYTVSADDYASAAKLVEDRLQPALSAPRTGDRVDEYPVIRSAKITSVKVTERQ